MNLKIVCNFTSKDAKNKVKQQLYEKHSISCSIATAKIGMCPQRKAVLNQLNCLLFQSRVFRFNKMPTFHVVCELIPKDAKNEQKPGANSKSNLHFC
jgi:hypothetical protein